LTLYHGSVDHFTHINQEGFTTSRLPACVTEDKAAAANAIGPGRVFQEWTHKAIGLFNGGIR
jgi:hypothetical protein